MYSLIEQSYEKNELISFTMGLMRVSIVIKLFYINKNLKWSSEPMVNSINPALQLLQAYMIHAI